MLNVDYEMVFSRVSSFFLIEIDNEKPSSDYMPTNTKITYHAS
ncbi:protein of unknown function [Candidatus Nitrosocosmicus franklandus]|uniref:Uncharacterized protein n=1 Tax=Candidatus Nitrosocosmicus franklandianus TaxID=1798806 RepID=A0A484I8K2_9ARCH|nr:protein of unknown function [Candidatus Nitrosocosmicus franklandus]